MDRDESFSRGYDSGNYGNSYESQDWHSWYSRECIPKDVDWGAYRDGLLLGFFSSYKIEEIPDDRVSEEVARLRSVYNVDND